MRPATTSHSSLGASAWPPCAGTGCGWPRQTARPSGGYRCRLVEHPAGGYDLIAVFVRAHQVDAVLESLAGLDGDVLFLLTSGRPARSRWAR